MNSNSIDKDDDAKESYYISVNTYATRYGGKSSTEF